MSKKNKFKSVLAGMILGLGLAVTPLNSLEIKPKGDFEIAYIPLRIYGKIYHNEIKGKGSLGLEAKLSKNFSVTAGFNGTAYGDLKKKALNSLVYGFSINADYKNYNLYFNEHRSLNRDFKNDILQAGIKIKIGNSKNKKGFFVNSTGSIDMSYVPSRMKFGSVNKNEIKTEFEGKVKVGYNDFFLNMGGIERTYETPTEVFNWAIGIQEYVTFGSVGYKNIKILYSHECNHSVTYVLKKGGWIKDNYFSFDNPILVRDSKTGKFLFYNQGVSSEIGIKYNFGDSE